MVIDGALAAGKTLMLRANRGSITDTAAPKPRILGLSAHEDIGTSADLFDIDANTLARLLIRPVMAMCI